MYVSIESYYVIADKFVFTICGCYKLVDYDLLCY